MNLLRNKLLIIFLLLIPSALLAKDDNKPVQIGYFEAGQYYTNKLIYREISEYLHSHESEIGRKIEFNPYGYRTAEWDRTICKRMAIELAGMKNLDIILAAGPWVIEDLIEAGYEGAIVGIYQFDPEMIGLVDSLGHPITSNMTLTYWPDKVVADIQKIKELYKPKNLGLVYFPSGSEFTSMYAKVQRASSDFAENLYGGNEYSTIGYYSFFKSFSAIRDKIDALYVPPLYGLELQQITEFFRETMRAGIPTFTAEGNLITGKGAMAGNSYFNHKPLGRFSARKIVQIIKGATPGDLPTQFEEIPTLALNLETARQIGFEFTRNQIYNAVTIPETPQSDVPRYSLKQILDQAERENVNLLKIDALYEATLADSKSVVKTFYPKVDLEAYWMTGDDKDYIRAYEKDYNREYLASVELEQKIVSLSSLAAIRASKKKVEIDRLTLDQARAELLLNVINAYLDLLYIEDELVLNEKNQERLLEYYNVAMVDLQFDTRDSIDISLLEEEIVSAKIETHRLNGEQKIAQTVLNNLINRPGDQEIIVERGEFDDNIMVYLARKFEIYSEKKDSQKKLEQFLSDYGITHSIELEKYDLSIGINIDLISQNGNRLIPDISFFSKYGYGEEHGLEISDQKGNWMLGLKANLALFPGNRSGQSRESLEAGMDATVYSKDQYRFKKYETIVNETEKVVTLAGILPMEYYARNLSKTNLESTAQSYADNKIDIFDLIHFYNKTYDNDQRLLSSRYEFFKAYAGLLHSLGVGYLHHGSGEQKEFFDRIDSSLGLN